ncbi:hypothetical protein EHN07_05435 [Buttiauxella warmboldiae]|uniref:MotA/TolQ/ExbB proton channel domain-containing protein n=1 Tax=Buttiauxella warmboldiae TaxID=82993 RepID=A0A3N5DLK0_9ENTR|nr:hypothetical protein [Buttiauxella warmboldiae]RPH29644.1 hypothetical protein EHN07_05435 [Buttiauxella warmboldiae]
MVEQAVYLAPELTYAMLVLCIYPLMIYLNHLFYKKKTVDNFKLLSTQSKLAASVCVSLGLVGTFQGLTAMVTAIASSMGGDGDVAEKMAGMLSSISSALSAMSYAFLTSIVGVIVSVLILVSLNFWSFYYGNHRVPVALTKGNSCDKELSYLLERLDKCIELNIGIASKLVLISKKNDNDAAGLNSLGHLLIDIRDLQQQLISINKDNAGIMELSNKTSVATNQLINKLNDSIEDGAIKLLQEITSIGKDNECYNTRTNEGIIKLSKDIGCLNTSIAKLFELFIKEKKQIIQKLKGLFL